MTPSGPDKLDVGLEKCTMDLPQPYRQVFNTVERVIRGKGYEIRLSNIDYGRILAHCPNAQGFIHGVIDVRVCRNGDGSWVWVIAKAYGSGNGVKETFRKIREGFFESLSRQLAVANGGPHDPWNDDGREPPPYILSRPDPTMAITWSIISGSLVALLVLVIRLFIFSELVELLLWPWMLVLPIGPFIAAVLCWKERYNLAYFTLQGFGVVTIMVLLFPTYFVSYALMAPMVAASNLAIEHHHWKTFYEELSVYQGMFDPEQVLDGPSPRGSVRQ